ncbi:MAG: YetF domain-containing protein [Cyclobacteriaceae bacterium]
MDWILKPDDPLLETLGGCILSIILIIIITRIVGLRSFAKFTVYDFAFTVAIGSIIGAVLTSSTSVVRGFTAIGGLLSLTYLFSILQRKSSALKNAMSNSPLLLMDGPEILYENLKAARVQEDQLIAKLREANVLNFQQVCAVVLEATGDISVLHKSSAEEDVLLEDKILQGVRRSK